MSTHKAYADMTQGERARHFGVSRHCLWNALHKMRVTRKKRVGYKEPDPRQRRRFLRLRERYMRRALQPVHVDECGFVPSVVRRYGYAPPGNARLWDELRAQKAAHLLDRRPHR